MGTGGAWAEVEEGLSLQALSPRHTAAFKLSHFVPPQAHAMLPWYVVAKKQQSQETMDPALPPFNYLLVTMEAN